MKPVQIFHIGPPKTATTWIYRCLKEHPEIAAPSKDSVHFFDMFYERDTDWYMQHFSPVLPNQKLFDPTPSYIWSSKAPSNIHRHNPEARIMFTLRNPIDRAFSHFWHLKKQGATNLDFDKILYGYDYFSTWLEPGLLGDAIERYLALFPKEQLHWILYQDIENSPHAVFRGIAEFCNVDANFIPSDLQKKINVAGPKHTLMGRLSQSVGRRLSSSSLDILSKAGDVFREIDKKPDSTVPGSLAYWTSLKKEYLRGIDPELRVKLWRICEPEIRRMEDLLNLDLSAWRKGTKSQ